MSQLPLTPWQQLHLTHTQIIFMIINIFNTRLTSAGAVKDTCIEKHAFSFERIFG